VENTGLPQISDELPELSALPTQDIPEAVRETSGAPSQVSSNRRPLIWGIGGIGLIALIAVPLILALRSQSPSPDSKVTASPTSKAAPIDPVSSDASQDNVLLGHRAYAEAPATELEPVLPGGHITLRRSAARKFQEMAEAAAEDGVSLIPLSGFRSISDQNTLFFDVKAERGENPTERATVSAPPGHSEHHTGYAVDIGDGDRSDTDLELDFETTEAFKWLQKNAAHYSFEMSFPKDNRMHVSYEPWHWRFVGDSQSLETFYQARRDLTEGQATGSGSDGDSAGRAAQPNPTSDPTP
jgi:D-alanyl-D-alanine carboxypeptidase